MNYAWPLFLQLLSLAVGVAEALVPSFGILVVVCLGLMGYSWYYIVENLPASARLVFGLADILLVPATVWLAVKLVSRSKLSHGSSVGSGSGLEETEKKWQSLIGARGTVETQLRPIGKVNIGGEIHEATTGGDLLNPGTPVKVVSAYGSQLIVEKDDVEKQNAG